MGGNIKFLILSHNIFGVILTVTIMGVSYYHIRIILFFDWRVQVCHEVKYALHVLGKLKYNCLTVEVSSYSNYLFSFDHLICIDKWTVNS